MQIIGISFIQNAADIAAVFAEDITVSADTADRLLRQSDNQTVRRNLSQIFAVIRDRHAAANHAANFALLVQHGSVRINAADVNAFRRADNSVGSDIAEISAGIVKDPSGFNHFTDIIVFGIKNDTVRHRL